MTGRRRELIGALTWLLLGVLAIGLVLLTVRTWSLAAINRATLDEVRSCTTPGEPCYERGQRQTADAVATIDKITVYAAACADRPGPQSVPQIQACVLDKIRKDGP